MGLKKQDFTLPEWAFLDANYQNGDLLKGRDVLMHVRTNTVMEFFNTDDIKVELNHDVNWKKFGYKNGYGVIENYIVAVHYSFVEWGELAEVIDKAIAFFCEWMDWMDKGIEQENITKHN